jgi:hypothetical protein
MKQFEIDVEQKFEVVDRVVYFVNAETKEEALTRLKNDDYDDIMHSEELDRSYIKTYWEDAKTIDMEENRKLTWLGGFQIEEDLA